MTIEEINKLIKNDETRTLELKKSTSELHKGMETACAFLNSDGGWLIFGIAPDLSVVGLMISDHTRQEIANALRKIEPAIDVEVHYIELTDKPSLYVIAIHFDATTFTNGPYTFDGRAYYKVESTTALMPRTMYEERLKLSDPKRFSWEGRVNEAISVDDLNTEQVYQVLHDGITRHRIHASAMTLSEPVVVMCKLGVARKDGSLTNAANVLFGKEPTMEHIQCKVRLARFKGTNKNEFVDQTVCEGNLFVQYNAVMDFCLKHLNLSGRMDRRVREERLTVPFEAIKEAAINMLVHRTWDTQNTTPSVAIYDDKMVFQNPGHFPIGYDWSDFVEKQVGSLPENPVIASVFYRCGLMESWGRGIELIMDTCTQSGLPKPSIELSASFVNLTIHFAERLKEAAKGQVQGKVNLTERQKQLLDMLREDGSLSVEELCAKLDVSPRTLRRERDVLKECGLIERLGSDKSGVWVVKEYDNTIEDDTVTLTNRQQLILNILIDDSSISLKELCEKIGASRRTLLREIELLKTNGLIERNGPSNSSEWIVKDFDSGR